MTSETAIETDEEFMDGLSPHVIHYEPRREAVERIVGDYARDAGLASAGIAYAQSRARAWLDNGHTAHRAIRAGEEAAEWYQMMQDIPTGVGC